jgi:hypothetical protein
MRKDKGLNGLNIGFRMFDFSLLFVFNGVQEGFAVSDLVNVFSLNSTIIKP